MTLFQRLNENQITAVYSNNHRFRAILMVLVLQAAGAIILGKYGLAGPGVLILFASAFAANLLFDTKSGILIFFSIHCNCRPRWFLTVEWKITSTWRRNCGIFISQLLASQCNSSISLDHSHHSFTLHHNERVK